MIEFVIRLAITILCLGFVVLVHEWGHFLVARRLGVRVERFTIGFGKEIFGWTRGDTRYAVCVLPLGGMVKMAGEFPEEGGTKKDEFFGQPWYGRATIALAGPVMNYVLAFVLFVVVAWGWGTLKPSKEPVIGDMVLGLPAANAKLEIGDRVRSINGKAVATWEEMAAIIHDMPDKKVTLDIERAGEAGKPAKTLKVNLVPQKDKQRGMGLIGVMPKVEKVKLTLGGSMQSAVRDIKMWTLQPLQYIGQKIRSMEGPKELSGPLGIAHMMTKATKEGTAYVIYLIAIISTGLGLFNLFPIPVLDGGHVFLYVIEGIIRRPLSKKALGVANALGFALIMTIFLYASYQDIMRWRLGLMK